MASPKEHFEASRRFQEYYDNVLRNVGMRAPEPTLGQTCTITDGRLCARSSAHSSHRHMTFTRSITVVLKPMPLEFLNLSYLLPLRSRLTTPIMSLPANYAKSLCVILIMVRRFVSSLVRTIL